VVRREAPDAAVKVNDRLLESDAVMLDEGDTLEAGPVVFRFAHETTMPVAPGGAVSAYLRELRRGTLYKVSEKLQIGRDYQCAVLLREPDVKAVHAEVCWSDERGGELRPMPGAAVQINGRTIDEACELLEGDEIVIGRERFRFSHTPGYYPSAPATSADSVTSATPVLVVITGAARAVRSLTSRLFAKILRGGAAA